MLVLLLCYLTTLLLSLQLKLNIRSLPLACPHANMHAKHSKRCTDQMPTQL
jgi:hypothetical protein